MKVFFDSNILFNFANQRNHDNAFVLSSSSNYIHEGKGLSMVDSLLLLQMNDENGVIYTTDKRMSFYSNSHDRIVAKWIEY